MAALAKNVGSLFLDGKYADLEIRCEGKTFSAHRLIVGTASRVLDKECSGGFLEANTRIVEHTAFSADTVERMLQFIYRGHYTFKRTVGEHSKGTRSMAFEPFCEIGHDGGDVEYQSISMMRSCQSKRFEELRLEDYMQAEPTDSDSDIDALEQHVFMYAIGDYYELPDLKRLAVLHFRHEKACLHSVDKGKLIRVVTTIYTNTSPTDKNDLRREIINFCIESKAKLLADSAFAQAIVELAELQDFTAEFIVSISRSYQRSTTAKATEQVMSLQVAKVHAQITELQAITICHHCIRTFSYVLERHGPSGVTWPGVFSV